MLLFLKNSLNKKCDKNQFKNTICVNKYELYFFIDKKILLGKSAKNKGAEAIKFREDNLITKISKEKLVNPNPQYKESSNILYILQIHL